jgi:putative CocE/NonD family hydrolase
MFPFIEYGPIQLYLDQGYAYVTVDVPGTGRSEGKWDPVSLKEGEAIHDMIEHVGVQDWSTGKVGMIGMSYLCWSQWNAARTQPPHLKTIVAFDGATDMYRDWMYHGGISIQGFLNSWLFSSVLLQHQAEGRGLRGGGREEVVYDMLEHTLDDEWQKTRSPFWDLAKIEIPVFSIGAWGKSSLHLRGNFCGYERVSGPKKLLVTEAASFAAAQMQFSDPEFHKREILPWYDFHLKGVENGAMDRSNVKVFVQGKNKYRDASDWPPPDSTTTDFYLNGKKSGKTKSLNDGSLTDEPNEASGETSWSYPDPQWVAGVTSFSEKGMPDHVARVITFTTDTFDHEREFTGQGVLELFASSDQIDMDVIVKLSLVTGAEEHVRSTKVSQGWLRASHRREDPSLTEEMRPFHSHSSVEKIVPGEIYRLRIELIPMSFMVQKGEFIRLEMSNTDSLIADAPMTHWYGQKVGTDTYHHTVKYASRLRLHETSE